MNIKIYFHCKVNNLLLPKHHNYSLVCKRGFISFYLILAINILSSLQQGPFFQVVELEPLLKGIQSGAKDKVFHFEAYQAVLLKNLEGLACELR